MTPNDDYKVGYGRPPVHTRFGPGQTGNAKGRKKGTQSLKEDLVSELGRKITIREGDKAIKVTMQQLIIKSALAQAAKGDRHARHEAIALIARIVGVEGVDDLSSAEMAISDKEMIQSYIARNFPGEKK